MKLTSRALIIAAAVLDGSLLVAANDYVVRTYTTEEPSVVEYTTAYETPCTTELEYPDPPKYETETVTETYTEPGKTIKKYKTVTKTKTLPAKTRTETSTYITTTTEVYKKTIYKPVTYTATATVTNNVTDTIISRTTDIVISRTTDFDTVISTSTIVSEVTTTVNGTPIVVPTTIFITQDAPPASTIVSEVTLPAPPPQIITEESTVTLPASTITTTIVQSGTTITSEIILPPSIIVQTVTQIPDPVTVSQGPPPPQTIIEPAQTVTITVPGPQQLITVAPPAPLCSATGVVPVSDTAGCEGRNCQIEFGEEAAVWWSDYPSEQAPPLLTAITFINTARRQTCITTSCNTELFTLSYSSSRAACVRPPCPSNSINHECQIVVGPLVLPDNSTTSVTQVGQSGWNLRLGPTATANDVGLCGGGVPQCVTATSRSLETPLIYIGDVIPVNNTGATPTNYILPQIGEYFPPGDPFGACETATLNSLGGFGVPTRLRARQAAIDPKVSAWKGVPDLVVREVQYAEPEAAETGSPTSPAETSATATPPTVVVPDSSPSPVPPPSNAVPSPTDTSAEPPTPSADISDYISPTSASPPTQNTDVVDSTSSDDGPDATVPGTVTENISGTMVVTNTVYYSMIAPPNQQRILEGISSLQTEDIAALPSESLAAVLSSLVSLGGEEATVTPEPARRPSGGSSGSDSDDSSGGSSSSGSNSGNGITTQTGAGEGLAQWRTSAFGWWLVVVALIFVMA
ncbi:uncharacterized protein RHO25_007306 [Cercospora beticola]|uniref:Uncharacterized protein n=1 Tax=Cercospora beticola TaxID=122368 RepID=A0ABZ0NTC7_CERBT|nr:hypothetical protein RHO25_007306 [Cercospora beticola]